jgi:hypothetical protein
VIRLGPFVHGAWADATGFGGPIEEVAASHASMVSQPGAVTRLILSAVEATSRGGQ